MPSVETTAAEPAATTLRVSPSSYDLWLRCERWWAFQYIEGIRPPSGDKANLGSICHTIAERYLRDGTPPDHAQRVELNSHGSAHSYYPGRIVSNILHHLPPAGSVSRCEERLDFRYRGIDFVGFIDWQTDTHIGDHKFTGDLAYAKRAQDLITDPQAVIYRTARWLESDSKAVTLQWTYGEFTAKASKVVRLPVVREFNSIDAFIPTIERIARVKSTVTEANSLTPTGLTLRPKIACEMYGGCPHLERCNRTGSQVHKSKLGAFMQSSVLERLRARNQAALNAQAQSGGITEATRTTEATGGNAHTNGSAPNRAVQAVQNAQAAVTNAGLINPPGEAHEPLPPQQPTTAAPANGASADVPATDTAVRHKPGRPRKSATDVPVTTTGVPSVESVSVTTAAPVSGVVSTAHTAATVAPTTLPIGTLYVNCRPVRKPNAPAEPLTEAYELIAEAHTLVREDQAVAHYKFIEYGKGAGALCVALGLVLDEHGHIPAVCITTRSAETMDVMQLLAERSSVLVVGV